jgi:hypothetical protein
VLDTLWKKPLPSKLFHLERVAHRPDNLLLPTTVTSLTRREDIHKFSPSLLWPVRHAQSSTAWPQQPIGKNKHALPQQVQQSRDSLTVSVSGLYEVFLQRSDGSRSDGRVECRRSPSHGSSWLLYLHAPGLTLVTLGNACVPLTCILLHVFPCQELRIK